MFVLFYNLFIASLGLVIKVLSWFQPKARKFVDGRKNVFTQLSHFKNRHTGDVLWMHVASLGEFEQGRPVIERWRKERSDCAIVLTFFSPSGYEVRKEYETADLITYLPVDTPANARQFLAILQPKMAVFVKYDFWYNFLNESVRNGVKVIFISALFRANQVYFNRGRQLFVPLFRKFDHFFVQNNSSKEILNNHGINQVTISGDTRLDRVMEVRASDYDHPVISEFASRKPVIIFGSIWHSDIIFLEPVLSSLLRNYNFILAPHHIDRKSLSQFHGINPEHTAFLSKTRERVGKEVNTLIIDEIGSLSKIYRYARYVYIGGALHEGLHNTLEAAVYGIPIFFAHHPNNMKFEEAAAMIEVGASFSLKSAEEMKSIVEQMDEDQNRYRTACQQASSYVEEHVGATDLIIDRLKSWH